MNEPLRHCPIETTVAIMGGKWKPLILYYLTQRTCRFSELKRKLPHVTQQMLTLQLRELERDGIVRRTVYAEVPPKVEYSLTAVGHSLEPVMLSMLAWGEAYQRRANDSTAAEVEQPAGALESGWHPESVS